MLVLAWHPLNQPISNLLMFCNTLHYRNCRAFSQLETSSVLELRIKERKPSLEFEVNALKKKKRKGPP